MRNLILIILVSAAFASCKKDKNEEPEPAPAPGPTYNCPSASCTTPDSVYNVTSAGPHLIFKFKFDSTQVRLDNLGMPATVPSTNEAVSPVFNKMSAHYIELAQNDITPVGQGKVLYRAAETDCEGGEKAITYCQSVVAKEGVTFFAIPISSITPGSYKWLRVSLAYQNYDIPYLANSTGTVTQWGTIASFLGFNTYITQYKVKNQTGVLTESLSTKPDSKVGGNYKQGYWGFETMVNGSFLWQTDGKSAATTVVNPNPSSPIPAGSCLVTGEFYNTAATTNSVLTITGSETSDIIITVSLSTNKSFEWKKVGTADGYYKPESGEFPVDMGIRGMIPKY